MSGVLESHGHLTDARSPPYVCSPTVGLCWRRALIRDFLERDLPSFGFRAAPEMMRRFWGMLAHWHGQVWNSSEFARAFGVADTTVRRHTIADCADQLGGP